MKKSNHLQIETHWGKPVSQEEMNHAKPSTRMRYADISYWKHHNNEIIEQEFDGHLGYLYSYDFSLTNKQSIDYVVETGDLHVLYLSLGQGSLQLLDSEQQEVYSLGPKKARYVYLAPGKYCLHVPKGKCHLFGFYFPVSLFRNSSEDDYPFIKDLVQACKSKSANCLSSVDFRIGKTTENYIKNLCSKTRKGDLDNEVLILQQITNLIKLSKQKIAWEANHNQAKEKRIAEIKNRIEQAVDRYGQGFTIEEIALELSISISQLNLVFKQETGQTVGAYKMQCVLVKAKEALLAYQTVGDAAVKCGFSDTSNFVRFFKNHTGITPKKYIASHS